VNNRLGVVFLPTVLKKLNPLVSGLRVWTAKFVCASKLITGVNSGGRIGFP
jgi:hypothetical protein